MGIGTEDHQAPQHCYVLTQNQAHEVNFSASRSAQAWAPCFEGHVMFQKSNVFNLVVSGQSLSPWHPLFIIVYEGSMFLKLMQ